MAEITRVTLQSADTAGLRLEARVRRPPPAVPPVGVAVLCHPHPAFGGHMDVWLLPTIGLRLAHAGWTVVRFNTRGARGSGGTAGDGVAERGDLEAALAWAERELWDAGARRALVGWSFGALVAMLAGPAHPGVTDWIGIAPPTRPIPGVALAATPFAAMRAWPARKTVIVGSHDQFFPPDTVESLHPDVVHVLASADHFLFDRDDEVAELVTAALRR